MTTKLNGRKFSDPHPKDIYTCYHYMFDQLHYGYVVAPSVNYQRDFQ